MKSRKLFDDKPEIAAEDKAAEIENGDLGEVKIQDGVLTSLARRAALKVDGVSRLAGSLLVDNLAEIVGSRRMQDRAIEVSVTDGKVEFEIKINVKIGFRLPEVARNVQASVVELVESITGMKVGKVAVMVNEIDDDDDTPESSDVPANLLDR